MRHGLGSALTWVWLGALGCSTAPGDVEDSAAPGAAPHSQTPALEPQPTPEPEDQTMRVLVTGFNDWKELGAPPNTWRCRDNPSCRLLLGDPSTSEPSEHDGPLVQRLVRRAPAIEWSFATMPVTWDVFAEPPTDVDVIVNIGLGVYDRFDALQLEAGAYNLRQGTDAAGVERSEAIDAGAAEVFDAPPTVAARLASLAGRTLAGYEIVVADARADNSYLCNETHYRALSTLQAQDGRLREVYFLHIPYAENDDYEALAEGVAAVVLNLTEQAGS